MIRKSLMPVQAEERSAGGNKTAFLPPASPSLSRQGRNPIQEPRSRPDLCLVRRFSGALGASWSGKGIVRPGSYEERGTEAKQSENGPMPKSCLRGLLQGDAQMAQVLLRAMLPGGLL